MAVQLYVLTSDTVLAAVTQQLRGAVDAWCDDWGVARDAIPLDCRRACEAGAVAHEAPWLAAAGSGEEGCWVASDLRWERQLRDALFPAGMAEQAVTASVLAQDAATAAHAALLARLVPGSLAGVDVAQAPPEAAWRRGAGALLVRLAIGTGSLSLFMNQAAVAAMARRAGIQDGRPPPLAPVNYKVALGQVGVRLPLEVGRAEVGLGNLMSLGVGDVIRLDTLADLPLTVRGPGGTALFGGHLGLSGQHVALEVVRHI